MTGKACFRDFGGAAAAVDAFTKVRFLMNEVRARGFISSFFYDTKSSFRIVKNADALHQKSFSFSGFSFRIAKS
jgi:hypothetical protein